MKERWFYYFKISGRFFKFLGNKEARKTKKIMVVALMAFALIYLVMPVDFIPDLIPILGYFEDGTILIAMLTLVGRIIDAEENRLLERDQKQSQNKEEDPSIIDVEFTDVDDES